MAEDAEGSAESPSFVDIVRKTRNKEQWARYDALVIGPGAKDEDPKWFNSWADFAAAEDLTFFTTEKGGNKAWSNASGEREDWAQLIYGMWAEFIAPVSDLRELTNPFDQTFAKWWTTEVPRSTYLTVEVNDTDNVLKIPAIYAPSGHGTTELRVDGAAAPTMNPGQTGTPQFREAWQWPIPLGIPAVKKIRVTLQPDKRIFSRLTGFTNAPGFTVMTTIDPNNPMNQIVANFPNRFAIRVGFIGPRFVQLRGARSQGET
jgi:hypothetical protein